MPRISETRESLSSTYAQLATGVTVPARSLVTTRGADAAMTTIGGRPALAIPRTLRILASFTGADSASSAGATTDTGEAVTVSGTWGIASNRLYNVSAAAGNRWHVDAGSKAVTIAATYPVLPGMSQLQLMARWSDASNYIWAGVGADGTVYLGDTVASTVTTRVTTAAGVYTADTRIELDATVDGVAIVRVDGVVVAETLAAVNLSGTQAGIRNAGDTGGTFRVDDVAIGADQQVAAVVDIPSGWATFDVGILATNASTSGATGNARFQYAEQALGLVGAEDAVADTGAAVTLAMPARGTYSEVWVALGRSRPATGKATIAVRRTNAHASDTFASTLAIDTLLIRQAS